MILRIVHVVVSRQDHNVPKPGRDEGPGLMGWSVTGTDPSPCEAPAQGGVAWWWVQTGLVQTTKLFRWCPLTIGLWGSQVIRTTTGKDEDPHTL